MFKSKRIVQLRGRASLGVSVGRRHEASRLLMLRQGVDLCLMSNDPVDISQSFNSTSDLWSVWNIQKDTVFCTSPFLRVYFYFKILNY